MANSLSLIIVTSISQADFQRNGMVWQFFLKRRMEIRIFLFLCPFQFLEFITCHQIQFKFPVDLKLCTDGRREVKASVCFSVCGKRPTDMTFQIRSQSPGLRYIKLRTGIKRNEQLLINRKSATRTDGKPLTDVVVTDDLPVERRVRRLIHRKTCPDICSVRETSAVCLSVGTYSDER